MRLRGNGILICEDCGRRPRRRDRRACVDGWDYGAVVLVFEEVVRGRRIGFIERVEEGGVEGPEGKFVDYVRKVECCQLSLV